MVLESSKHTSKKMISTVKKFDATSLIVQDKKECVQDLDKGSCWKSMLQSPLSVPPLGVIDEFQVASGFVRTNEPDLAFGGVADIRQVHTGTRSMKFGLTKAQKRKLRRKLSKFSSQGKMEECIAETKRFRSDHSTPSPVRTYQKKPKWDPTVDLYPEAVKATELTVVRENFPLSKLSLKDADCIQEFILMKTDSIPDGGWFPEIIGCNFKKGTLIILCFNSETEDWIKDCLDGNKEVLGKEALKVISANELPKPVKVSFKTKNTYTKDHSVFLRRLAKLNPKLKPMEWQVLLVVMEQHSTRWIFEVELADIEAIKSAGFKAYTGLDRGVFKILHDPNSSNDAKEVAVAEKSSAATSLHQDTEQQISLEYFWQATSFS